MKTRLIVLVAVVIFAAWMGCEPPVEEGYHLTFKVDMTDVELVESDSIGIRGSIAPLSWTETYPMEGPDEAGFYKVTIPFKEIEYGLHLEYKFIINDSIWDNDSYGEYGNRFATICCKEQVLPVDIWNQHEGFDNKKLLESAATDIFMSWIYTIAKGKERGLTPEEIARENVDFWGWQPDTMDYLNYTLHIEEFYQAKTPWGYFEVVENTPEKVEYIKNKDWEILLYMWNDEGVAYGVTADEMTALHRKMLGIYVEEAGWKMNWQDEEDHRARISIYKYP